MVRADIPLRVREIFSRSLNMRCTEATDDLVVGELLISDERLGIELVAAIHLNIISNVPGGTIGQLIANLERQFDELPDWRKKNLAEAV